jgi:serine/threonine protein kinase
LNERPPGRGCVDGKGTDVADKHPWEKDWKDEGSLDGGGQGETRRVSAKDGSGRKGVIKLLKHPERRQARERMYQEVSNLDLLAKARVKVPAVLDKGTTARFNERDVELYFVMDFIHGRTLEKEIRARGPQPLDKAVALTLALCRTVGDAHKHRVYHRDLKPGNVMVRDFDTADLVIVDYGLSFNEEAVPDHPLTRPDEQLKNRFIFLPELTAPGGDRQDPRSDLTAVCGHLYYCLTGHPPLRLEDGTGVPPHRREGVSVRDHLKDPRVGQVESLLNRGFRPLLDLRFQTAAELEERLQGLLRGVDTRDVRQVSRDCAERLLRHDRFQAMSTFAPKLPKLYDDIRTLMFRRGSELEHPFHLSWLRYLPEYKTLPEGMHGFAGTQPLCGLLSAGSPLVQLIIVVQVAAKGAQCVLLRQLAWRGEDEKLDLSPAWEPVHWFDPEAPPDEKELEAFVNSTLSMGVERLTGRIAGDP